ncbi:hypothetical protein [Hydrogenothermus marinus]|uniref:Uncharacterized protein n=1 Tax=Hydrogenothermus marinus TaxID=133270 RepID=A0A3M0BRA0_9AQUI|nr:hypothetical protein [Hydrogenothermus marinus]RMA97025.1 hypothetical protein CLV39_0678 [Hydrogenothermus marinus]
MQKFKLKRYFPQEIEIEITDKQLLDMFPIEEQEHPFMGNIERVWKSENQIFSIKNSNPEDIIDLSGKTKHIQLKKEKMFDILSNLEKFQIILYYEDKEDLYDVIKI